MAGKPLLTLMKLSLPAMVDPRRNCLILSRLNPSINVMNVAKTTPLAVIYLDTNKPIKL